MAYLIKDAGYSSQWPGAVRGHEPIATVMIPLANLFGIQPGDRLKFHETGTRTFLLVSKRFSFDNLGSAAEVDLYVKELEGDQP